MGLGLAPVPGLDGVRGGRAGRRAVGGAAGARPVLDPALLRNRVFAFANVSFMICMLALFAVSFLLPFYLEELQGFDTLRSGLLLTPLPLTLALLAPVSGALADRVGSRWLAPLGLAIACAGLLLLSGLTQASSIASLVLCLIVTGIGQGLFQSPNARAIMGAAPPNELECRLRHTGHRAGHRSSLSVAVAGAVLRASAARRRCGLEPAGRLSASSRRGRCSKHS